MARLEVIKCDGCGTTLDTEKPHRWVTVRVIGNVDLDICRECWRKMLAAVDISPESIKEHR